MSAHRPEIARWSALFGGCLCVILGCYGAVYAVKASIAQTAYRRIKYGHFLDTRFEVAPTRDPEVIRIECARLMNLYPHNYCLPVLVADVSLSYALVSSNAEDKAEWLRRACRWDDDGMRLNPYNAEVYSVH
ncbi:MAG: hypothetical protein FWF84_07745, partial [Kiritimatiellaeota bacterium]|nr:hypothetical protein [Kiritimatiellota bacterium]